MKKLVILMIGLIFAGFINAQPDNKNQNPEERAVSISTRMTKNLDLNKDQEKKVFDVYKKFFDDMKMMREKAEKNRELMQEMNKKRDNELKGILTEEQFKRYEEFLNDQQRPNNRDRRKEGRRDRESSAPVK
ncbi:MAG: hypothetical protein Q7J34_13245 [Bacteroidales bacterium]|nr:hypothetical protein [Bacteroidales bacterium]